MAPQDFDIPVNPISLGGGGILCLPRYHLPPKISDLPTALPFLDVVRALLTKYNIMFCMPGENSFLVPPYQNKKKEAGICHF